MPKKYLLNLIALFTISLPLAVSSAPAGNNQLSLKTGTSKRIGESAFSYSVSWRKDDGNQNIANGLLFIDGTDSKNPSSSSDIAYKITKAINSGVAIESPHDRGATAKQVNSSEVVVSNQSGFDLTQITVRDYTNQKLSFTVPEKNFNAASIVVAIDVVYSAAVEYVDGFSTGIKHEAAGGFIKVTIDQNAPIEIDTTRRSSSKIEQALAQALGSKTNFSTYPLFPNFVELRSKNYKDFDGGEMQFQSLNAKTITIESNDPGLGLLIKFKFPDKNKPTDVIGKVPYLIAFIIFGVFAYLFYGSRSIKVRIK